MKHTQSFESCLIHTTVGIYSNGDYVVNGVKASNLEEHIKYNITMRPGRTLMVDGKVLHEGYGFSDLEDIIEECSEITQKSESLEYS